MFVCRCGVFAVTTEWVTNVCAYFLLLFVLGVAVAACDGIILLPY